MQDDDIILLAIGGVVLWFFMRNQNTRPGSFSPNAPSYGTGMTNAVIPLTVSANGRAFIKNKEGFTQFPKPDAQGTTQVGYGHQIKPGEDYSAGVSKQQASNIMDTDLVSVEDTINNNVAVPIDQNQFDALADFTYEEGIGAFKGSTLLKILNTGNYAGAAQQFSRWVYANGQVSQDIVNRRAADQSLFTS